MLVITRNEGERIFLDTTDGTIEVFLYAIKRGKCRVGIEAPRAVKVRRDDMKQEPEKCTTRFSGDESRPNGPKRGSNGDARLPTPTNTNR